MNLERRLGRLEATRPPSLTADEFCRLWLDGQITDSRFDAFARRLPDDELQRAIDILSVWIEDAK